MKRPKSPTVVVAVPVKKLSPAEEENELREIKDLFWKYIANSKFPPDPDAESPIWTKLK
jgi:hypothetical protein